ncbi:MAG TPA: peptidase S8, partial [Bacteroidetes bacterium]|nr:peptidase S8 [Bacteroidota bacterium]
VELKVFDINGKEVGNLVNSEFSAGEYEYTFNGSNLTSGIYFYTLKTNNFSETKKMTLIK